jgi:trehalose/maltose hydrolase-like predicted phosphorylase
VVQRRFVSRQDQHLAGVETEFTAENWSGTIQVRSGLDGRVVNVGVKRYRDLNGHHLTILGQAEVDTETVDLQVETNQSHVRVAPAGRTRLLRDGKTVDVDRSLIEEPGFVAHDLTVQVQQTESVTVEKIVALYTSRDRAISESRHDAGLAVDRAGSFAELLNSHERAWLDTWDRFDLRWTAPTSGPKRSCTRTSSSCCKRSRTTVPTWTSECRHAVGTGRPTAVTSSGMSCSSSRTSTSSVPGWPGH